VNEEDGDNGGSGDDDLFHNYGLTALSVDVNPKVQPPDLKDDEQAMDSHLEKLAQ
jgi:hypothetical protein